MQQFLDAVFGKDKDDKMCESYIGLATLITWIAGNDEMCDNALRAYGVGYFLPQILEGLKLDGEKETRITDVQKRKFLPGNKVCVYNVDVANANINIEVVDYRKRNLALITTFDLKVRNLLNFLSESFDNNLVFKLSLAEQRVEDKELVGSPLTIEERKVYLNDDLEHITVNTENYNYGVGLLGTRLKETALTEEYVKEIEGNAAKKMIGLVTYELMAKEKENE